VKTLLFSLLLGCLLVPFLAGCGILTTNGQAGTKVVVQQNPKARLTYVAIGASDTFGIGADDPSTENWAADLAAKIGSGVRLVNLGIPGITLHEALTAEVPVAIDAHPDLVTIWLALNDLANNVPIDSYTRDLDLLLTRVQAAAPHARIAIANVPDLTLLPYFNSTDPQTLYVQIQSYNDAIASVAKRHSVIVVDLYQKWQELRSHPEYISSDGLHPGTLGYTQIADLFYQALQVQGGQ
jgi:lysophospholipase L1-like esterase